MKRYKRADRVREQLIRDLSSYLDMEFADSIDGLVTFTRVKLSDDLRHAVVYYSFLGQDSRRNAVQTYLEQHKKKMRTHLSKVLNLRAVPELAFKFDPAIEDGIRIEKLLNEISNDTKEQ